MRLVLLPLILVPLGALASVDCGILQFPVTGPEALIANSQLIQIQFEIVDQDGNPLDDVTVHATGYALNGNPIAFNGLSAEEKNLGTQKAKKWPMASLSGNRWEMRRLFFLQSRVSGGRGDVCQFRFGGGAGKFSFIRGRGNGIADVKKNPTQRVVLVKKAG